MAAPVAVVAQKNARMPFLFDAAQRNAIPLVTLPDRDEPALTDMPAVTGSRDVPLFAAPDDAHATARRAIHELDVGGVITTREEAVAWTGHLAASAGLPGIPADALARVRDKASMRACLRQGGVRAPRYRVVAPTADLAAELAGDWPMPVVVKPRGGLSSAGVIRVDDVSALNAVAAQVRAVEESDLVKCYGSGLGAAPGLVVEEFVEGPEFVVEALVHRGRITVLAVGEKGQPLGPHFEETVYRLRPDTDSAVVTDLAGEAVTAIRALGLDNTAIHCELRLDAANRPHVIEVGARIGGSGVSHFIVETGTGYDFAGLALQAALGRRLDRLPTDTVVPAQRVAANYIIPLGGHGRYDGIQGLDAVAGVPATRRLITFLAHGHEIPPFPHFKGYPGFILSSHPSLADARAYHAWLDDAVTVSWGPAG